MEESCGFGKRFRPQWLQRFATARWFLVVYGLLGLTQTMAFMYFIATLTTMEKRFKIPSKTTGIMMTGNEISQILLALTLSYYGGRGNRPRWIGWGVALSGISCFILAMPHFLYGAGSDALALTEEYQWYSFNNNSVSNETSSNLCRNNEDESHCDEGDYSVLPLFLVFLSQFVLGIGTTLYYALGQTYLDDNIKKVHTPLLLGCIMSLRAIGPAFGFLFGYLCLSVYVNPLLTPMIDKRDPRWIGAWWLGWVVLGVFMILLAGFIALFPLKLPKKQQKYDFQSQTSEEKPLAFQESLIKEQKHMEIHSSRYSLYSVMTDIDIPKGGFVDGLKRLVTNKLIMFNNAAAVFYIIGASGYINYVTKYMETQFQKSAAQASALAGTAGIFAMVFGFLISGAVISKFKPRAVYVLGWNVIVGVVYVSAELIFMTISCPDNGIKNFISDGMLKLHHSCNADCHCAGSKYSPICHIETGQTYYSACYAGCSSTIQNNSTKFFSNCSCATGEEATILLEEGPCNVDCNSQFIIFLIVMFTMHIIGSTGKVGNVLVNYRAVRPEDKSFAQGLALLMTSLFAFIPGPILFGAIIDSTCLVWNKSCTKRGNCWLYDKDQFRTSLNTAAACFTIAGTLLDAVVCYLGRNLKLYEEPPEKEVHLQEKKSHSANSR